MVFIAFMFWQRLEIPVPLLFCPTMLLLYIIPSGASSPAHHQPGNHSIHIWL